MSPRFYSYLGFGAPILFWGIYLPMASWRDDYSIFSKAISELGAVDAPHAWVWNFFGYIIPGLLIAVFSIGLYQNLGSRKGRKLGFLGISMSGLFMALSGVFPGDFENRASFTMIMHVVGSFGSYIFFLIGVFSFARGMKTDPYWKNFVFPGLLLTAVTFAFGAWPFVFPQIPSLGQRVVFLAYFSWISLYAYALANYRDAS
jgi:hypothetical membrane protein